MKQLLDINKAILSGYKVIQQLMDIRKAVQQFIGVNKAIKQLNSKETLQHRTRHFAVLYSKIIMLT
jgi:alkylhydroperoxidase/carboxymuconolactone decarboxylase family protein YurZ